MFVVCGTNNDIIFSIHGSYYEDNAHKWVLQFRICENGMFLVCGTNNDIIFSMHGNGIVYRLYSCCQILIANSILLKILKMGTIF